VVGVGGNVADHQVTMAIEGNNPKPPPPGVDAENWKRGQDSAFFCTMVISGCVYLPVLMGGYGLTQGRGLALGVIAAIMAMLPCSPGFLVGLPIGIWALVALNDPDVRRYLRYRK